MKGKSFQQWFIDDYMLNEVGMSPLVSGFFWDDVWTSDKCFGGYDQVKDTCKDMGLTSTDLAQGTKAWNANMAALREKVLSVGKFAWQVGRGRFGSLSPSPLTRALLLCLRPNQPGCTDAVVRQSFRSWHYLCSSSCAARKLRLRPALALQGGQPRPDARDDVLVRARRLQRRSEQARVVLTGPR